MLVLSRLRDETIMIGDEIEITVVDIRGDKIRLGISAPARIAVHRKEVYEAIGRENREAAQQAETALPSAPSILGTVKPGPTKTRGPVKQNPGRTKLVTPVAGTNPIALPATVVHNTPPTHNTGARIASAGNR
jgi:carbon storage regulator